MEMTPLAKAVFENEPAVSRRQIAELAERYATKHRNIKIMRLDIDCAKRDLKAERQNRRRHKSHA